MSVLELVDGFIAKRLIGRKTGSLFVGIGAVQGAGKTTLVKQLKQKHQDLKIQTISIDDYYYSNSELNARNTTDNRLLRCRGAPGTHQIDLLIDHLVKIKHGECVDLLQYDKSLNNGAGSPSLPIQSLKAPDIVLVEGWMVGFQPLDPTSFPQEFKDEKDILEINDHLQKYMGLYQQFDIMVYIKPLQLDYIFKWRLEQEHQLINLKGSGKTDQEVVEYVQSLMPLYRVYDHPSLLFGSNPALSITIDLTRRPQNCLESNE